MDIKRVEKLRKTYFKLFAMAGVAHILYTVIFVFSHVPSLVIYNVLSVLTYIYISVCSLSTKNIYREIEICLIEVVLFSLLGTIIIGNSLGFGYLFISALPICYYVIYSISENKKKSFAFIMSLMGVFILTSVMAVFDLVPKVRPNEGLSLFLYFLNALSGFFLLIVFFVEFMGIVQEDTKLLMQKNKKLNDEANYDQLTKLLNRRSYDHCMDKFFDNAGKGMDFSVVMFDIDDFKNVNDAYGHSTGDIVLRSVADAISSSIRPSDIAIRWGGEEILLIIQGGGNAANLTAERCRKAVEALEVRTTAGKPIKVTATAGCCTYMPGVSREDMIEAADRALYQGKGSGKNCVVQGAA